MRSRAFTIFLFFITLPAWAEGLKDAVLARMDKAASEFKNMTARAAYVTHTDVINEDSPETSTVVMQKVAAGEVRGLINFLGSDKRTVSIENRRVRVYYPKINIVQEFDLGKDGEQLDQFLMIGFGTSGTALAKNYDVTVLPTETVKGLEGIKTIRLQVIPKAGEARKLITKLELWIPETGDPYPVQEKISEPSGDYRLITYTGIKTNQPLPPDALQLKTPQGVKTEYPGK
jgi:outer membrane lipoprotein-sorting protein